MPSLCAGTTGTGDDSAAPPAEWLRTVASYRLDGSSPDRGFGAAAVGAAVAVTIAVAVSVAIAIAVTIAVTGVVTGVSLLGVVRASDGPAEGGGHERQAKAVVEQCQEIRVSNVSHGHGSSQTSTPSRRVRMRMAASSSSGTPPRTSPTAKVCELNG